MTQSQRQFMGEDENGDSFPLLWNDVPLVENGTYPKEVGKYILDNAPKNYRTCGKCGTLNRKHTNEGWQNCRLCGRKYRVDN